MLGKGKYNEEINTKTKIRNPVSFLPFLHSLLYFGPGSVFLPQGWVETANTCPGDLWVSH